jgi:hypothetical protein
MTRRHRKMKGGFLETLGNTLSSWGSSISQGATSAWDKTKRATESAYQSATGPQTSSYTPSYSTTPTYPGTGGRRTKRKRGGYSANFSRTNLASHAASFSGKTAQPYNWVGGKTKRHRKHKHTKSCKCRNKRY